MTGDLFGPALSARGIEFRLWAPAAEKVALVTEAGHPMRKSGGWFTGDVAGAKAGTRYHFRIDDEITIADPASRFQPEDVHGASEVIDQNYAWRTADWKGRAWADTVILELHIGTFTAQGTYRAAIGKLDHIVDAGFTAIELMPLSDFPGRWNWGYDGVLPFAPDSSYGRPEDLKALIDAAHASGLMVFLDVVYNHFGPDGNYLGRIAPQFFSKQQTPWGGAIDYTQPEARAFAIENAVYWLRDYRFDGLRLDAVHAIVCPGSPPLLSDLSKAVGHLGARTNRQIHLILENDDNCASLLGPSENPPQGGYRAQWNDDYHHAWHVLLTGERQGYYKDYSRAGSCIARALAEGFCYQGEPSPHRKGRQRGEPSAQLPPSAFVNFLQNHDQIGNRAHGERLTMLAKPEAVETALAVLLLAPSPPLLFMGEEWGATEPFPFFCDFEGDLAEAVRNGRKAEFDEAYAASGGDLPDPLAETTVRSATLDWNARSQSAHKQRLSLTRGLLRVRQQHIVPFLAQLAHNNAEARYDDGILLARWRAPRQTLTLLANLSDLPSRRPPAAQPWSEPVWGGAPPALLPPWSVFSAIGGD